MAKHDMNAEKTNEGIAHIESLIDRLPRFLHPGTPELRASIRLSRRLNVARQQANPDRFICAECGCDCGAACFGGRGRDY